MKRMQQVAVALIAGMITMLSLSSCQMIRGAGVTEEYDAAIKTIVIEKTAEKLAAEGIDGVTKDELDGWYDAVVQSDQINAIASSVASNAAMSNKVMQIIEDYRWEIVGKTLGEPTQPQGP